jgi:hypothetical protein
MALWQSGLQCGGASPPLWFLLFLVFFAPDEAEKQKRQSKALPHFKPD